MKAIHKPAATPKKLRTRAEQLLATTRRDVAQMPVDDVQKLVHELQVHQIELEMQNEQLRRTELELEAARDRYADLYDFAPVAHLTLKTDGEILEANLAAGKLLGLERDNLIHKKFSRFVPAAAQDAFFLFRRRVSDLDERQRMELNLVNAQAEPLFVQLDAVRCPQKPRTQFRVSLTDITVRQRAEECIAKLSRVQGILGGVDRAIVHGQDRQELLDEVCRVVVEKGGFKLAWIGMVLPDGSVKPEAQAGVTGYLKGIRVVTHDEPEGHGPAGEAIRENRPVVIEDIERDTRLSPWRNRARKFGLRYVAAFPIRIAGKVAGAILVYAPQVNFFDENELELMTQVSDDISFALTAIVNAAARKQAEAELHASDERFRREHALIRSLIDLSPDFIFVKDTASRFLVVNDSMARSYGRQPADLLDNTDADFMSPEQAARCRAGELKTLAADSFCTFEDTIVFPDGQLRTTETNMVAIHDRQGKVGGLVGIGRDITESRRLESALLEITDREQQRIGHDLHDGLGQQLTALEMQCFLLMEDMAADDRAARRQKLQKQAQHISQALRECIAVTRSIAHGLAPAVLKTEGLAGALEQLAQRTCVSGKIECRFVCRSPVTIENLQTGKHLYRIAQEAVNNALKHARARRIRISLARNQDRLRLQIKDDGRGLPKHRKSKSGMGLEVMQHRAHVIGAALKIVSKRSQGVNVICTLPLSK